MTSAKLDKIHTEFVFFKAFPDESTVEVVYSLLAGTMGDGAEYPGWIPCGAKLDKTRPKFRIFKFFPDEIRLRSYYPADGGTEGAGQGRKSPC